MKFYKYQGAGNDFLIADNRDGSLELTTKQIADICDRRYGVGADGVMLLESSQGCDFRMDYYNSDGSGGMMCGNGGRCIVAFAFDMGLRSFDFEAADGFHTAQIIKHSRNVKTVRLKMKDVEEIRPYSCLKGISAPSEGYFLDTGTRHYVRFVDGLDTYDIVKEGRHIRYDAADFQPVGVNVNFVEPYDRCIKVRTYEKGVEDETFACGTGIVASCIAARSYGVPPSFVDGNMVRYDVLARRDCLSVDFVAQNDTPIKEIWLTGPATFVAEIDINV